MNNIKVPGLNTKWGNEMIILDEGKKPEIPVGGLFDNRNTIVSHENHIYFYSDITSRAIFQFNTEIKMLADGIIAESSSRGIVPTPIWVHIHSCGGSIFAGFSGMDAILNATNRGVPVFTVIEGMCASAATFMSIVGSRKLINPHAYILIHQISSYMGGTFHQMTDDYKNAEKFMEHIKNIYIKNTKISQQEIDEFLLHDIWWNAETALSKGIVDEINYA